KHRPGCLAIAGKCMNDFAFGEETKNCILACNYESANILCAEPVCRPLDAGFRSYGRDAAALPPQNAFDGHILLPSCGLAACLANATGIVVPTDSLGQGIDDALGVDPVQVSVSLALGNPNV